jgi:hypothetical protein
MRSAYFWNNHGHQQARSQSKDWKTKIILKSLAANEVSQINKLKVAMHKKYIL